MVYQLMNLDNLLIEFDVIETLEGNIYKVLEVKNEEQMPLMLQSLGYNNRGLTEWINRRTVSVNRHHMEKLLGELNLNTKFEVLMYCKGLSLTDCFWVKEVSETKKMFLYANYLLVKNMACSV